LLLTQFGLASTKDLVNDTTGLYYPWFLLMSFCYAALFTVISQESESQSTGNFGSVYICQAGFFLAFTVLSNAFGLSIAMRNSLCALFAGMAFALLHCEWEKSKPDAFDSRLSTAYS